ncbi:MAG TPA: phage tail protein [Bryobacteraceae bacterium]|nr:phage tail protein [Bryobacteraceae bacterium]
MSRIDPVLAYNFTVTLIDASSILAAALMPIQRAPLAGFSECGGLDSTLEIEEYREGGNNGTSLKFPTRITWGHIHLKRGVVMSGDLWQWHFGFVTGQGSRRDGVITLQDDRKRPIRVWTFTRGLPVKWTGPAMNAGQNQLAIEELEIAHEGLQMASLGI